MVLIIVLYQNRGQVVRLKSGGQAELARLTYTKHLFRESHRTRFQR